MASRSLYTYLTEPAIPMESYGLWNLPSGFWPATNQNNVPLENVPRPGYYAPAALPVLPAPVDETDIANFPVTGTQYFRPHTDFLSSKNLFIARPVADDKSHLDGLLPMGDLLESPSMESTSNDSTQLAGTNSELLKSKIKRESNIGDLTSDDTQLQQMEELARQQGFPHPMYELLLNQMSAMRRPDRPLSDEEEELASPSLQDPPETESSLLNRSTGSSRAGYECGECGLVAETRPALKKHIVNAHPDQQDESTTDSKSPCETTVCPVSNCQFRATDSLDMENHVSQHVSDEFTSSGKKKTCPVTLQRVRYEREEYRCQLCSYSCTIEKAYHKHLKIHSMGQIAPMKISCVICGKDRTSEVDMSKHMKKHRDDRYFCCDICKFKTVQLKKLIQHRRMHTGEKPHLCPHCSYRSARRDNLRSHVRRVHKKENIYCDTFSPRTVLLSARTSTTTSETPQISAASPSSPLPAEGD